MFFGLFESEKKRAAELLAAARSGDLEKLEALLLRGASVNTQEAESGDSALIAAIGNSRWAAAELLLKHHPDLNLRDKNGQTALFLASAKGDAALSIVNLLLAAGADTELGPINGNNVGASPLHVACALGSNECVASLIKHRASVNKALSSGEQPAHTAAIGGGHKTIELLHKAGADLNALTSEQRSPLHNCGIAGNAKVAAALLRRGVLVDPKDKDGFTPLLHAVLRDKREVAKTLLSGGADPNYVVQSDETVFYPLLISAAYGLTEMAKLLIENGATLDLVDGGQYLADCAKKSGHATTERYFQSLLDKEVSKSSAPSNQAAPSKGPRAASKAGDYVRFKVSAEGVLSITT